MCESGSDVESARKSRHSKVFPMSPSVKVASHPNPVDQDGGSIVHLLTGPDGAVCKVMA